jgi:hypothetical protein
MCANRSCFRYTLCHYVCHADIFFSRSASWYSCPCAVPTVTVTTASSVCLAAGAHGQRAFARQQSTPRCHASQGQWPPRPRTGVEDQPDHREARVATKASALLRVNAPWLPTWSSSDVEVVLRRVDAAAGNAMGAWVGQHKEPRWLWPALDHWHGRGLASVFGQRPDEAFWQWQALREPCGLTHSHPDYGGPPCVTSTPLSPIPARGIRSSARGSL